MTNKQRIKKLQKQNDMLRKRLLEAREHLGIANRTVLQQIDNIGELVNLLDIAENALERDRIIKEYLEDYNARLIQAMA